MDAPVPMLLALLLALKTLFARSPPPLAPPPLPSTLLPPLCRRLAGSGEGCEVGSSFCTPGSGEGAGEGEGELVAHALPPAEISSWYGVDARESAPAAPAVRRPSTALLPLEVEVGCVGVTGGSLPQVEVRPPPSPPPPLLLLVRSLRDMRWEEEEEEEEEGAAAAAAVTAAASNESVPEGNCAVAAAAVMCAARATASLQSMRVKPPPPPAVAPPPPNEVEVRPWGGPGGAAV